MGKVLIAVPCMGSVSADFFDSIVHLRNDGTNLLALEANSLVYNARAHLTMKAIEIGAEWMMFIDSDMVFPPDVIEKLLDTAISEEADLVTGIYFKRKFPTQPVICKNIYWSQDPKTGELDGGAEVYEDYPRDSVFPIEACGMACTLIKLSAIQDCANACRMSPYQPLPGLSEDFSFCFRMKQLGKKMLCDSRVKVGHIGTMIFDEAVWLRQQTMKGGDEK